MFSQFFLKNLFKPVLYSIGFHLFLVVVLLIISLHFFSSPKPLAGGGGTVTIDLISKERFVLSGTQIQTSSRKLSEPRLTKALYDRRGENAGSVEPAKGSTTTGSDDKAESGSHGASSGIGTGSGTESGRDPLLAAIRIKIEHAKHYPELAQKSGIQGRALVHFQINDRGLPQDIILKNSSGSQILDQESLKTIQRAAPYPLYKNPLEVWIHFSQNQ